MPGTTIDTYNDSYLMIVWGSDSDRIKILDYKEPEKTTSSNVINDAIVDSSLNITGLGKAAVSALAGPIVQNIVSKSLPPAVLGRINSSISEIVKDGKVENQEVLDSFITSCTGELDNVAIDLGLPTPSSLYDILKPTGPGLISAGIPIEDFVNKFSKVSEKRYDELITLYNEDEASLRVLKMRLVVSEEESYSSSLPQRKTEKGFNFVDYVSNEDPTFDFSVILGGINNDTMYDVKDALIAIRNSKLPFDVYVNDKINTKQYQYKRCLFGGLDFSTNNSSVNSKECSFSLKPIPEGTIKTEKTGSIRTEIKSKKTPSKLASTTPKKVEKYGGAVLISDKLLLSADKGYVNSISDESKKTRSALLKNNIIIQDAKAQGTSTALYVDYLLGE